MISKRDTYIITPAAKANDDARTRVDVNFTMLGKKTAAAPIPVESADPITSANAIATFSPVSRDDIVFTLFKGRRKDN